MPRASHPFPVTNPGFRAHPISTYTQYADPHPLPPVPRPHNWPMVFPPHPLPAIFYPPERVRYPSGRVFYPPEQIVYPPEQTLYPPEQVIYPPEQMFYWPEHSHPQYTQYMHQDPGMSWGRGHDPGHPPGPCRSVRGGAPRRTQRSALPARQAPPSPIASG
ncbi:hypothetical protein B0T18DRAFT_17118 [Schizothecium vesticola]|uniref:Uncharacterized protein n=1 Tax=Schizothecium vesticola TaxID=314040 RepID=A0AA40F958_9PEZI|nr:hypothetical protein B0T18DRAFT_17118 [Schizothecium vesticola]